VVRLRRSLGRQRSAASGFRGWICGAREDVGEHCSCFYDGPAVADDPLARRRPFERGAGVPIRHSLKRKSVTSASRRLVLLQVGAARGTSPTRDKDQPEMSDRTHGGCGRVAARSRCPAWGGGGPRLRDSGGGFAARERTAGQLVASRTKSEAAGESTHYVKRRGIRPHGSPAPGLRPRLGSSGEAPCPRF
jgi:hypothetical protein